MTDDFAAPPAPDGTPSGALPTSGVPRGDVQRGDIQRSDFRPTPPARRRATFPRWVAVLMGVGALVIVAGVAVQVVLTVRNSQLAPADPHATGRLHSTQVVSGMCIESLGSDAGTVMVVSCDESHGAEAVSAYTFTGDAWPGDQSAADTVLGYCAGQLAPGAPLAGAADGRDWVAWVPSESTWRHGDRKGLCIVTSDTPWTGDATDVKEHAET